MRKLLFGIVVVDQGNHCFGSLDEFGGIEPLVEMIAQVGHFSLIVSIEPFLQSGSFRLQKLRLGNSAKVKTQALSGGFENLSMFFGGGHRDSKIARFWLFPLKKAKFLRLKNF